MYLLPCRSFRDRHCAADNEEQSDGRSDAEDEADGAEADEGDVEISDAEEEQPALSGIEVGDMSAAPPRN